MSFFRVDGLSLSFGGIQALRNLSFEVGKGEVFAIIGPNGAGKTTAFNAITRVFDTDGGRIYMEGQDITHIPRHHVVRRGIARTFQNIELFEGATVLQNLLLGGHRRPAGNLLGQALFSPVVRRAEIEAREKAEDIIELLQLQPYRHSLVSALPYGVRKVVELGRALTSEPKLLLLDEPASGLNPEETRDLSFWIEDMKNDLDLTIIMIEHDMSLVSGVADRVLVMNQGQPIAEGAPQEVQRDPAVVAAYLGG